LGDAEQGSDHDHSASGAFEESSWTFVLHDFSAKKGAPLVTINQRIKQIYGSCAVN